MITRIVAWVIERAIDLVLLAYLAYLVFGSNESSAFPGVIGDVRMNMGYVLYFFIASGYVATTAWFGFVRRSRNSMIHSCTMIALYLVHVTVWLYVDEWTEGVPIQALGACVVAFSSLTGNCLLALLDNFRKDPVERFSSSP